MKETIDYLPLGSIVIINGGIKKYVIIARGLQVKIDGGQHFFDYGACMYPEGMIGDQIIYFQHSNIKKVIFHGFSDDDDKLLVENIQENFEKLALEHVDISELKAIMENANG